MEAQSSRRITEKISVHLSALSASVVHLFSSIVLRSNNRKKMTRFRYKTTETQSSRRITEKISVHFSALSASVVHLFSSIVLRTNNMKG